MLRYSYGSLPNDSSDSGSEQKKSNMLMLDYHHTDLQKLSLLRNGS